MALLIQQVSLSRYFNIVEKNGEITTNYLLLFVGGSLHTLVITSPPELQQLYLKQGISQPYKKLTKSFGRFNPGLRRATQHTNKNQWTLYTCWLPSSLRLAKLNTIINIVLFLCAKVPKRKQESRGGIHFHHHKNHSSCQLSGTRW